MPALRILSVEASAAAQCPPDLVFRWTAHHVKEILLASLPKRFTLDGSGRVTITCGPSGGEPQYLQVLGTSNYFVEDFDFAGYAVASPQEREQILLSVLVSALQNIASRHGVDPAVIAKAADEVREREFELSLEQKKLARTLPGTKVRVTVLRRLSSEHGESWSAVVRQGKDELLDVQLGDHPDYLDRTDFYKTSRWDDQAFVIANRLGQDVARVEVGQLLS